MLKLFPFQEYAVNFLVDKRASLIGDEMGLGKSLQAVALDRLRREKQPNLVRKPKTLVITYISIFSSWAEHFETETNLRVIMVNPRSRVKFIEALRCDEADVFIVHWQALRLMPELTEVEWFHIIGDEIHALQNRKSKQTLAAKKIKTYYKTGLSGTPAYDKPDDLWSILNWLYPKFWSSFWWYYDQHIKYVEQDGYRVIVGVNNVEKLQQEMSGFYVRRRKQDVLLDLPDKYYTERVVELDPKQKRAYQEMKKNMLAWVGENENQPVVAPVIIAQLTRLQQFSDAYGELVKIEKIDKVTGQTYHEWHMRLSEPSTKLDAVMDIIDSTAAPVAVFSQFSQVIELLAKRLEKAGIPHGIVIGPTSSDNRKDIIRNFQAGKLRVFAGTIAAGGIGITLTAASTVVFVDRTWSASLNLQAEDRLHRIGQKNAVQVIDIISRGTLDAKRMQKINLAWSWIKRLIGDDTDLEEGNVDFDYNDFELETDW